MNELGERLALPKPTLESTLDELKALLEGRVVPREGTIEVFDGNEKGWLSQVLTHDPKNEAWGRLIAAIRKIGEARIRRKLEEGELDGSRSNSWDPMLAGLEEEAEHTYLKFFGGRSELNNENGD